MRGVHELRRTGFPVFLFAAVLALALVGVGGTAPHDRQPSAVAPAPTVTVEPLPGLALDLSINAVEETASGGIASLTLLTTSALQVETLSLIMHLPPHVIFADGSKERTWEVTLDAGGRGVVPIDLLVDRPGRFHISAEAIGIAGGRTIRRGTAYPLVVGRSVTLPEVKNGAIEYRGQGGSR